VNPPTVGSFALSRRFALEDVERKTQAVYDAVCVATLWGFSSTASPVDLRAQWGYGVSIMGIKELVLDGNTGGTPTDNSGEPGAVLHLALVAVALLPAGATLGRGR